MIYWYGLFNLEVRYFKINFVEVLPLALFMYPNLYYTRENEFVLLNKQRFILESMLHIDVFG